MDERVFGELLATYLLPMLPGAELRGSRELSGKFKQKTVASSGGGSISIRPFTKARFEFRIRRKQGSA